MRSSLSLSLVSVPLWASSLLCDFSSGSLRPLVPLDLCHGMFDLLYSSSHPGICASCRLPPPGSFGLVCPGTWVTGLKPVSIDSRLKSNPCSCFCACHSCSYQTVLPCSPGSCGPFSLQPWFYLPPHYDQQDNTLARGGSVELPYCWVLYQSISLLLVLNAAA